MEIRVLGCGGAELPHSRPPAFLVDGTFLLDAGTVGAVLAEEEQAAITHIFLTHAHLDHTRGIPFLADNRLLNNRPGTVEVVSGRETIEAMGAHLMNDSLWPDFTRLGREGAPVIAYREITPEETLMIDGYSVTAFPVAHTVPALGYVVRKGQKGVLYTGDTGPTEAIWPAATGLSAMIVEVSFPNAMEGMALLTGHLTPNLMRRQLEKMEGELPPRILISHMKPQFRERIEAEVGELGLPQLRLARDGDIYSI